MDDALAERLEAELSRIGGRLRRLRRERGWTLGDLSERTGLSTPYLSRVEAGERQPSLAALFAVCEAYGVTVSSLLDTGDEGGGPVVRSGDAGMRSGNGLSYAVLSRGGGPGGRFSLQPLRVVVPAEREGGELYRHEGEEWVYVLSGRLGLRLGGEELVLEPGDAAHFDASEPHRLEALGGEDVEMIVVAAAVARPLFSSYL